MMKKEMVRIKDKLIVLAEGFSPYEFLYNGLSAYTELALEVSRVVIRAESAETKLEAVRELLPRIEAWIKKPVCGCAPMHNDGDCLEHQILPLLKKILPEKEYECEHCHKKSPASLWIADECPICKTYNMPF